MRRAKGEKTLSEALEIAGEYSGNLTVRQLYYQLVARGHIANSQESYKGLVALLGEARLVGDFPFEWLLDRTREARAGRFKGNQTDVDTALDSTADDLRGAPESWLWRRPLVRTAGTPLGMGREGGARGSLRAAL